MSVTRWTDTNFGLIGMCCGGRGLFWTKRSPAKQEDDGEKTMLLADIFHKLFEGWTKHLLFPFLGCRCFKSGE